MTVWTWVGWAATIGTAVAFGMALGILAMTIGLPWPDAPRAQRVVRRNWLSVTLLGLLLAFQISAQVWRHTHGG